MILQMFFQMVLVYALLCLKEIRLEVALRLWSQQLTQLTALSCVEQPRRSPSPQKMPRQGRQPNGSKIWYWKCDVKILRSQQTLFFVGNVVLMVSVLKFFGL